MQESFLGETWERKALSTGVGHMCVGGSLPADGTIRDYLSWTDGTMPLP